MLHSFLYAGGTGIWRPNPVTREVESTEAHGVVCGLAKLRVVWPQIQEALPVTPLPPSLGMLPWK